MKTQNPFFRNLRTALREQPGMTPEGAENVAGLFALFSEIQNDPKAIAEGRAMMNQPVKHRVRKQKGIA